MNIDIGSIFGDVQKTVEDAWGVVTSAGVPAVLGGLQQYAAEQLGQLANANKAAAGAAINGIMNQPPSNSGLIHSISDTVNDLVTSNAFKNYGGWIAGGFFGIVVLGYYLGRN